MTLDQMEIIADEMIPKSRNKFIQIKKRYSTGDIIEEVLQCYKESNWQVKKFAPFLKGATIESTCRNVWLFLKHFVKYKVDPEEVQWIKEPAKTWHDRQCDCKSYSIFIATLLKWLGIHGCFRFVSFNSDPNPTHVYIVVRYHGKDIIIDDVMPRFNAEKTYKSKKDYSMQGLYRVSGLPTSPAAPVKVPVIGRSATRLPVLGCMDDDSSVNGLFSNVFRGAKKVLSAGSADKYLKQLAPALLYRYMPAEFLQFSGVSLGNFFSSLPSIVQQKVRNAENLIKFMHDKWAMDNYHIGHTLHNTLKAALGMEPQHYLALVINPTIDNFKNNTSTAVGKINWATTAATTGTAAAAGGPAAPVTATAAFLANMAVGLSQVDLPDGFDIQSIAPAPEDWAGYPTQLQTFVVNPTVSDPLGSGINNGLYDSNGNPLTQAQAQTQPQNQIPAYQGQQPTYITSLTNGGVPGTKQAGMNPILMIGLAGAAIAMIAGGKKKKKGGRK